MTMTNLHRISWILAAAGLGLALISWLADFPEVWLLAGILLFWAGIVKIVIIQLWLRVAGLADDTSQPTRST